MHAHVAAAQTHLSAAQTHLLVVHADLFIGQAGLFVVQVGISVGRVVERSVTFSKGDTSGKYLIHYNAYQPETACIQKRESSLTNFRVDSML